MLVIIHQTDTDNLYFHISDLTEMTRLEKVMVWVNTLVNVRETLWLGLK